jgi:hypothetical protein
LIFITALSPPSANAGTEGRRGDAAMERPRPRRERREVVVAEEEGSEEQEREVIEEEAIDLVAWLLSFASLKTTLYALLWFSGASVRMLEMIFSLNIVAPWTIAMRLCAVWKERRGRHT